MIRCGDNATVNLEPLLGGLPKKLLQLFQYSTGVGHGQTCTIYFPAN